MTDELMQHIWCVAYAIVMCSFLLGQTIHGE